jgi:hypothetical protein
MCTCTVCKVISRARPLRASTTPTAQQHSRHQHCHRQSPLHESPLSHSQRAKPPAANGEHRFAILNRNAVQTPNSSKVQGHDAQGIRLAISFGEGAVGGEQGGYAFVHLEPLVTTDAFCEENEEDVRGATDVSRGSLKPNSRPSGPSSNSMRLATTATLGSMIPDGRKGFEVHVCGSCKTTVSSAAHTGTLWSKR